MTRWLLLALALVDLDTWLLPYPLTVPLLAGGLAAAAAGPAAWSADRRAARASQHSQKLSPPSPVMCG